MNHKKSNKKSLLLFSILFLYIFSIISLTADASSGGFQIGDWLIYDIVESSDTENAFYGNWPPGTYFGNWSVTQNDQIQYSITSITENGINGTLFLGNSVNNVTFLNVRNVDLAFGLTIGIYPWSGGFFANASNWENIETQIQFTNTTTDTSTDFFQFLNGENGSYEIITFETLDYYGQFSNLYYHSSIGVLLKAQTSYGSYNLSIELTSTNLEIEKYTKSVILDLAFLFLILPLVPLFKLVKSRSNQRKG